jgi:NtrC-family two-component system response regulator AlgB
MNTQINIGDPVPLADIEREHIERIMEVTRNLGKASAILGIDAATLYRKRKKWGKPIRERKEVVK